MTEAHELSDWDPAVENKSDTEAHHTGHYARLTGAWYCDTCDSPYCELI